MLVATGKGKPAGHRDLPVAACDILGNSPVHPTNQSDYPCLEGLAYGARVFSARDRVISEVSACSQLGRAWIGTTLPGPR